MSFGALNSWFYAAPNGTFGPGRVCIQSERYALVRLLNS